MNVQKLLRIISGDQRGLVASLTRGALGLLTPLYRTGVWLRNRRFDSDPLAIKRVDVPVISIGNLTTGGTGKTPLVIWLCQFISQSSVSPAIVSRGYQGRQQVSAAPEPKAAGESAPEKQNASTIQNDEALELAHRLPGVPHVQNADRVKAARLAIADGNAQVIVVDDGFQHRRLHRDLNIVMIDATNPFGFGRLLPRGLLREPISALARANIVILSRCEQVDGQTIEKIESRIGDENPHAIVARTETVATGLMSYDGTIRPLPTSDDSGNWFALSAIGNPVAFERTLERLNFFTVGSKQFADHHHFSDDELAQLAQSAKSAGANRLVCTHKDLVKICANEVEGLPLFALLIETRFLTGRSDVESAVNQTLASART